MNTNSSAKITGKINSMNLKRSAMIVTNFKTY